jgi:large repetitive protein
MKKYKIMKKILNPTISTLIPKSFYGLLKPALLMLVLVVMGSNLSFGQVSVQVMNSTNHPTLVQNNSISYDVPAGGSRMLLVMISNTERTVSTITFNGVAMTLVTANTTNNRARTHIYRLLNPAQGFGTLVVNFNGNEDRGANIGIVTLGNVDQADPTPTSANIYSTAATVSHSVTSVAGQLVLNVVASSRDVLNSAGAGQTEMWNFGNGSEPTYHGGSYIAATGSTTTMTWAKTGTQNQWSMSLVSVKPACIMASVSFTNPTCAGGPNGSITVSSPVGGSGTYEYRLDAGTWQSSNTFTGLAPGTYSVQIRDANNTVCEVTLGNYTLTASAVDFDAVSSQTFTANGTTTPITLSHTTGSADNRLMLVGISTRQRTIGGLTVDEETVDVTYGGESLVFVGSNISDDGITYIFMMVDPPSGAATLSVKNFNSTLASSNAAVIGVTTYSNVDLSNPIGTYTSSRAQSATPSITIASTTQNQTIFNVLSNNNSGLTVTDNSGQTQRWFSNTDQPTAAGYTKQASAGSTTLNYTLSGSNKWSLSGVAINPMPVADLAVTKSVNFSGPYAGQTIEFTLTATNLGCDAAPIVIVEDLIPSGYIYVSHTASGTTEYNVGAGIWDIGTLNVGVTETLEINVVVNATGNYTNTATISGGVVDNNAANNTASASIILCQAGGTPPLFNN